MEDSKKRKPRGQHIEETAFMKALDADPAAAMMALVDETAVDWKNLSPHETENILDAETTE